MAVVPGFDPNDPGSGEPGARRNRAVTDPTEPGSAFKPIIACGALDGGFVSLTEKIDCHNGVHYFGRRRVTDTSPQGMLNLTGVLIHSSNIGMGTIAQRMGNDVLYQTVRRFGFGDPTGVELPGEDAGLVRPVHRWTSYSTNAVAIGYELAVTPLQLITAFSAIVNDGVMLEPRLVRRLLSADGDVVGEFTGPEPVRRVVSIDAARYMVNDALVVVVEQGSARHHVSSPYRILGKTGTAKLPFADRRGYEPGAYVSTFLGAAPAPDPEITVLVMIRRPDPARGYYGSAVAAPAAGRIITGTLAYMGVAPAARLASSGL
jgi:cell division protein FtsI (penicillin-binding protein 3)